MSFILDALTSKSALKREVASLLIGNLLLFAAWAIGYLFLPEGILRGKTAASAISNVLSDKSVWVLTGQILLWNGLVAFALTPLAARFVIDRFPLAYLIGFGNAVLFGLYLGTNSMKYHPPSPPAPSLTIFRSNGAWEIAAYLTVAAALARLYTIRQETLFTTHGERVPRPGSLGLAEWTLLGVSAAVLVTTAWIEAQKVIQRG